MTQTQNSKLCEQDILKKEPIAVIGIGCRFPGGGNSPEEFWKLLCEGTDAITEVPNDRWNLSTFYDPDRVKPGKTYTRRGGFLEQIDQFDAQFFGISPREASRMDPQQRLLLEIAWEALEDGGQVPAALAGTNTGVFIGIASRDYGEIQQHVSERNFIDAYTTTGSVLCSVAPNRISYFFDLRGPSIAIDTACSSSLVAVDLACRSIWNGDCTLSMAGGANVLLKPEMTIGLSKGSFLSPDGLCQSFAAGANGYVRAEGAGIVILKPLSKALSDGDRIYATIRGSAVNQDGHTNGMTVPNGDAQEAVLREAYQQAGILPEQISYVEAHGTGTSVGDPIEANALGNVLRSNRPPGDHCFIGSVKSNIGHLEAAAGIAGLIKTALILKHGQIPPNLHFEIPNPKIPFEDLRLRVPQTLEPFLQKSKGPCLAGVNSFGAGGTNAHVVLSSVETEFLTDTEPSQASKAKQQDEASTEHPALLPLSAHSPEALQAFAKAYLDLLSNEKFSSDLQLSDICYAASQRRSHHDYRLTVVAKSKQELAERLEAFLEGETRQGMSSDRQIPGRSPKLTFVFSGMGAQWWGMGRQLLQGEPLFREKIEHCDRLLSQYTSWSLLAELTASEEQSRINETEITQAAIFSVQVALAALWSSWGIYPDAIVGHSVGEVAAAHVAGVLSLEDAVRVIFHRSRVQAKAAGQGKMLAIGMSSEEAQHLLVGYEENVSVGAINSPSSVTLSGDANILQEIAGSLEQKQIFCRFLRVEVPYHSIKMEPLKAELIESLQDIKPSTSSILLLSTVTGKAVEGPELDATYWAQNMRAPVLFAVALDELMVLGYDLFLEINAHPVLVNSISECFASSSKEASVLPSLRRQEPERAGMLGAFGGLYTMGYPVDWNLLYSKSDCFVDLPSYPWQRERYWQESEESQQARLGQHSVRAMMGRPVHPLLGCQLESAMPVWDVEIDKQRLTYLYDHRVQNSVVYSGAAYVEMALAAAKEIFGDKPCVVEEIKFQKALFLPESQSVRLQLCFAPKENGFEIYSLSPGTTSPWVRHVAGKLNCFQDSRASELVVLEEIRRRCCKEVSRSDFYQKPLIGYQPGPHFQGIERLWSGEAEALGQVVCPDALEIEAEDYYLHPIILDSGIQALLSTITVEGSFVAIQIDRVCFYDRPGLHLWSYARLVEQSATRIKGNIQLLDDAGNVLVEIQGLQLHSLDMAQHVPEKIDNYLYEYQWKLKACSGRELVRPPAHLTSPLQVAANVQPTAQRLSEKWGRKHYYETVEPQIDILCAEYILQSLQQLGYEWVMHQRFFVADLAEQLGVVSQHWQLLGRMLEILENEGLLSQIDGQWEVCQIPEVKEPQKTWQALLSKNAAYQAELTLLRHCGHQLAGVLRGEVDPLQLIFPQGSLTTSEHFYQDSPTFRLYNLLVQQAIAAALKHVPQGQTIRILEIGGGTGGMTSSVLPLLSAHQIEYVFTDVSQLFTVQAAQKFRDYPFVQYQVLDIEKDPVAQGFAAHSFDLILASNVLHATTDLRHTLENVKQLLASEGLSVLLEITNSPLWVDLVFGLLKGWWLFSDRDLRPLHPLLSLQQWQGVMRDVGFTEVTGIGDPIGSTESLQTVIVAKNPCLQQQVKTGDRPPELPLIPQRKKGSWLIFADSLDGVPIGVGQQLAELLEKYQEQPILVSPGKAFQRIDDNHFQISLEHPEDMQQLLGIALADRPPCCGVVHLWNLDALPPEETTVSSLESAQLSGCISVLHLVQALAKIPQSPRLWLVSRGTQTVGESVKSVSIAQSPLWGLGRLIASEHPELRCKMVDLGPVYSPQESQSLFEEFWSGEQDDDEDEIALRGEARYVHRLTRIAPLDIQVTAHSIQNPKTQIPPGRERPLQLDTSTPGALEKLALRAATHEKPSFGEVEIQICTTGLNFKDVAKAMDWLASTDLEGNFSGRSLGIECAGKLIAIGEGVEGLVIGDEVIALAPQSFSTGTTADARFVVPKPIHISFEEAATIPFAFITAYYALHSLGRIDKSDRILIHAAAESVGLAAIQLAQHAGAEILATADTLEKREFLQAIGVQNVMDSAAFAEEVMHLTGGKGVDIILNSLARETIPQSISVLGAYGRFIEIGLLGIDDNSTLELRAFRNNLSFFTVDLDQLLQDRPDFAESLFREVMQLFVDGTLHPLPYRVFSISKVVNAFQHMEQSKHIGKIVVSGQDEQVLLAPISDEPNTFRTDGSYLIVGGLSECGLAIAQWMVECGARHLVLIEQNIADTPVTQAVVKAMREAGAEVTITNNVDMAQEQQVKNVLADMRQSMPLLRGVICAATGLDSSTNLMEMTQQHFQKVMASKAIAAWNVHTQTLDTPLDFFILLSSTMDLVGNAGQGDSLSANTFLEALAHHRRARGLPALSVSWDLLANGALAQNQNLAEGRIKSLPLLQFLKALGELLRLERVQTNIMHLDWQQWAKTYPEGISPRFSHLVGEIIPSQQQTGDGHKEGNSFNDTILAAEPSERQQLLQSCMAEQVAKVLGTSISRLDIERSLTTMGLDSLMAVELSTRLKNEMGMDIPTMKLMGDLSIIRISEESLEQLTLASVIPSQPPSLSLNDKDIEEITL